MSQMTYGSPEPPFARASVPPAQRDRRLWEQEWIFLCSSFITKAQAASSARR